MPRPYHPPLSIAGRTRWFTHLDPFDMDVDSRKAGRLLRVHVRFTTHCFSRAYDAGTHPEGEPILRDAGGRPRTFCPIRYRLSERLPALIRALNHPKAAVTQTAQERNWLHAVSIEAPEGPYYIFFELRRAPRDLQASQDLNMVIESAYPAAPGRAAPRLRGSMGFVMLCGKTWLGEPVATRR